MILCRSVHKYITFCSEPLIRTLIRRIKCRISASQTFITYTMRIKSANITKKKNFLFFSKNGCLLICLRIFIRISTVSYSSHSHQRSQHNYCHCGSCRFQDSVSPVPVILKNFKFFLCCPGASCLFSALAASLKSPFSLSRVISRSYPAGSSPRILPEIHPMRFCLLRSAMRIQVFWFPHHTAL